MRRYYIAMAILVVISVSAVIAQAFTSRNPAHDRQVVTDLEAMHAAIEDYAVQNEQLPPTQSDIVPKDPPRGYAERQGEYTYRVLSSNRYEVCATFLTASASPQTSYPQVNGDQYPGNHTAGHQCFKRTSYMLASPSPAAKPLPAPAR